MRVCHIVEASGGGCGRVVLDLVLAGARVGDDVSLIYSPLRAEPRFIEEAKALASHDIIVHKLDMYRLIGWRDAVSAVSLFRFLFKTGPYDILHAHSSKAGGLVRIVSVFLPRAKCIYTPHAFVTLSKNASFFYRAIEWGLSFFAHKIIAVSSLEKKHAVDFLHISPSKVAVIPNGIHAEHPATRATARTTLRLDPSEKVVGFVARFVPQKNLPRFIATAAIIHEKQPDIHFIVVGDGEESDKIRADIAARGLGACLSFVGARAARPLMPAFDCLLNTSDFEAFPILFLEALFAGVPIVSTPVGGADECVIAEKTGVVTEDFSPTSLADAVLRIMAMDDLQRARMQRASQRHAAAFSVSAMAAAVREVYADVLR